MAIGAGTIFQVQSTATASNVNGGGFNPGNANFLTNGAATSANGNSPVFTSASYNFVAGDVGAWIYIKSGTNWTPGWYKIASVAANAATLQAAIGQAVSADANNNFNANTVAGCATVASPTAATWGIDYSQQDSPWASMTDLAVVTTTTVTSASHPFGVQHVGNMLNITAGTAAAGVYEIVSVSGTTATIDRSATTTGTGNTAALGGAFSNVLPAMLKLWGIALATKAKVFVKGGSSITYTPGANMTGLNAGANNEAIWLEGFVSLRGDLPTGATRPTIVLGANTWTSPNWFNLRGIIFTSTTATGVTMGSNNYAVDCKVVNTSATAAQVAWTLTNTGGGIMERCEGISYRGAAYDLTAGIGWTLLNCTAHDSNIGIEVGASGSTNFCTITGCLIYSNVSTGIHSFAGSNTNDIIGNTFYGSEAKRGSAITGSSTAVGALIKNNIFYGFATAESFGPATGRGNFYDNNNFYNNTTNRTNFIAAPHDQAVDPQFTSVTERSGSTATTTAGNHLVQTGATFQTWGITAGVDYVYISGGTGVTAGIYGILSVDSETQITVDITLTANATGDKVWSITQGHNFAIGNNLKALGQPGVFPGAQTTGYTDIGGVQRQESAGAFTFAG